MSFVFAPSKLGLRARRERTSFFGEGGEEGEEEGGGGEFVTGSGLEGGKNLRTGEKEVPGWDSAFYFGVGGGEVRIKTYYTVESGPGQRFEETKKSSLLHNLRQRENIY